MEVVTFRFPTRIRCGVGARRSLESFAAAGPVKRPLLVTDGGLPTTEAYALAAEQMDRIWPRSWQSFSGVHANPREQDVDDAWQVFRGERCDAVIGLGGGSALDAAKALRLRPAFPQRPLSQVPLDGLPERLTPMCAIPTTAGTGSEVGRSAVITLAETGQKAVIGADSMLPELAILDPELTRGLPPHLTAATGMDAMTHAVEAYVCPMYHPMCDGIALEAIRMVRTFLPLAVSDGSDLDARMQMLVTASMGAVAFQKDLGAAHSLAHPLSTEFGVQHGLANAIVLPHVVRFNGEADASLYTRVADALALEAAEDPAPQVAEFLEKLNRTIGITQRLRDLDVPRDSLPKLSRLAIADPCHRTNPRPCSEGDLRELYEKAW